MPYLVCVIFRIQNSRLYSRSLTGALALVIVASASATPTAHRLTSHESANLARLSFVPTESELAAAYARADAIARDQPAKALMTRLEPHWIDGGRSFSYRLETPDGNSRFILVDAATGVKTPAFDHEKLAKALSTTLGHPVEAGKLPLRTFDFTDDKKSIRFASGGKGWVVSLSDYAITPGAAPSNRRPRPEAPWTQDTYPANTAPHTSPDGKSTATIVNGQVVVKSAGKDDVNFTFPSRGATYVSRIQWTPDSQRIVATFVTPGDRKPVFLIQSTPPEGGRAKLLTRLYDLPGDKVDTFDMAVLDVAGGKQAPIQAESIDYGDMPDLRWSKDGRHFTYEKIDRGYSRWRIIEVDSVTGESKALVDDQPKTFFDSTSKYSYYCESTGEIIWRSERDGWGHLYLSTPDGQIHNQITKGSWVVRAVDKVDEKGRQIVFQASGVDPSEDPYFIHFYRVNFDGTGLTQLTPGRANHEVQFSPDGQTLIDTYSTVTEPQVHVLRRASDGTSLATLERADITKLAATGWKAPQVFVAKGRDGKTDIWGIVYRPSNFDPKKKYPVVENIYAGPQDSYVPKSFAAYRGMQSMAELGFVVVQMDGMGTRNRGKAFHDVAYKNLADAGFPDRILWMKALAASDPSVDISRVGVYGTSAGGQNSTGAVLFHPEFYKVAVSSCGCHDNRMDKIWWNEQWMGPMGPHYAEQSNITNAAKLKGKLLLMVGELDHNVPPESTFRLVDALIKANKDFEFLVLPGFDHTAGGPYGERKRRDFFVKNLLGVQPPNWNEMAPPRANSQ